MIADDTREELSMEEILSSIKDILDGDMQPDAAAGKAQVVQPEVSEKAASVSVKEETADKPVSQEPAIDKEPAIPVFSGLENIRNEEPDLPVVEEDDDILDLSSAMIIPEKAAENAGISLSGEEDAAPAGDEDKPLEITGLDDIDIESLELPDLSDVHTETALSGKTENPLDELAQSPFYQHDEPEEENPTAGLDAEIGLPEENRGLLSDILKNNEPEEEVSIPEIRADAEPSDLRIGEEISEYTVNAEEAEPFYPETESLPVIEPDAGQIVNQDILEDYKTRENEPPRPSLSVTDGIETPVPDGDDMNDVSAGIINSFAKMFSHAEDIAPETHQKKDYTKVESLGNASLTIEDIVESVVYDVVSSRVDAALQSSETIEGFAKNEIARQTQIWLTTQMPSLIEALVKKEIERVMAKVGR